MSIAISGAATYSLAASCLALAVITSKSLSDGIVSRVGFGTDTGETVSGFLVTGVAVSGCLIGSSAAPTLHTNKVNSVAKTLFLLNDEYIAARVFVSMRFPLAVT